MKKSRSNNYWEQREQKWIEQRIKNDNAYLNEMAKRYKELANSIQQQINGFYAKYASDTGLTMSEAVKKINSFDVKSFEETAAKMVAKKDFSQYANDRLKTYNATMKINRLEFLKAQLGLEITNATNEEELAFNDYLLKSYQDELKRQSGILGYHKNVDLKQNAATVVNASFHGATWSSRLWINQDVLKAKLDTLLSRAMIQGTNPKQMIASLRTNIAKEINNTTSVIENLVVTESARVQDVAQMESLKRNGFKFCKWIAEPTACKRCREIAESNNEHGIGVYRLDDVPMIPEHPRCRCSKAAYWVDEKGSAEASRLKRKKNTEKRVTINKEKQRKLTAEFRKNGGKVWQGAEAEHYLKSRGAAAMTLGDATIVLQNKPTISEVLEELYHIEQFKNGEIDDDISKYKAEIEAQNYLLSVEKMYNIPRREIEETKRNLNYWKGKLENENK
ncbi:MAG: minor capsid protein [Ligilactobacillus agilis]|nr:minor capsid protein [Ligilactobacillus agilis]MDY4065221.1 minor capsid protein [Ligilactobacillus agilis]